MKYLSLLSFAVIFVFSSCNKYSEGPNFSLLTKKARVVNDWTLDSYTKDGTELYDEGYEENGEIVCGVVFDPIKNEFFCAEKGNGAYLNLSLIHISEPTRPY